MNVPRIRENPEAAQRKLEAYRQQLRRRADEEYTAAAAGYEALAAGKALINLTDAVSGAGLGEDDRPQLAVGRADRKQVVVETWRNFLVFSTQKNPNPWNSYTGTLRVEIPSRWKVRRGYALVPMVPADVRPNGDLRDFFILWEVEAWSDTPLTAIPDRDPLLLRHLAGDLYVVEAEWDLTDLERAVMAGRAAR